MAKPFRQLPLLLTLFRSALAISLSLTVLYRVSCFLH